MIARLEKVGERLLARVVPNATAEAGGVGPYCHWKSCGYSCVMKLCCAVPGEPNFCNHCRWVCG